MLIDIYIQSDSFRLTRMTLDRIRDMLCGNGIDCTKMTRFIDKCTFGSGSIMFIGLPKHKKVKSVRVHKIIVIKDQSQLAFHNLRQLYEFLNLDLRECVDYDETVERS